METAETVQWDVSARQALKVSWRTMHAIRPATQFLVGLMGASV